jgi:cell division protein FtsZ
MLEVQEAAKIITESVDKDARIIFGAFKDEKLKKGEIKVTVIATGFPNEAYGKKPGSFFGSTEIHKGSSPFGSILTGGKKDEGRQEEKKDEKKEEKKMIFNEPQAPTTQKRITITDTTVKKEEKPKQDDDDWSAIPAFLRRKK